MDTTLPSNKNHKKPKSSLTQSPSQVLKKFVPRSKSTPEVESPHAETPLRSHSAEILSETSRPDTLFLDFSEMTLSEPPLQRSRKLSHLPVHTIVWQEEYHEHRAGNIPPLIFFAQNNHEEALIQATQENRYNINQHDEQGEIALTWAIRKRNDNIIRHLLQQPNIDINCSNKSGNTALHYATLLGNVAAVQLLLACPNLMPNKQNCNGFTPAHCAAQCIHDETGPHAKILNIFTHDPRVTFSTGSADNEPSLMKKESNQTPHDLIARKSTDERIDFRKSIFSRLTLDLTVDRLLGDLWTAKEIIFDIPRDKVPFADDDIIEMIQEVKSKTHDCWIGDYADDDFIKKMILARFNGVTPIRATQVYS